MRVPVLVFCFISISALPVTSSFGGNGSIGSMVSCQEEIEVSKEQLEQYQNASIVVVGNLSQAVAGPVSNSLPPIYHFTLEVDLTKIIKGDLKDDETQTFSYSARQDAPPEFKVGQPVIVYGTFKRRQFVATGYELATSNSLERIEMLRRVPTGWSVNANGKPVSPWPDQAGTDWSKLVLTEDVLVCAKTGRPATRLPGDLELSVEKVPPVKEIKWTNPDGDGEYKITLTNPTNQPVNVNSLLTDGEKVLWDQSLLILCQNKTYTANGTAAMPKVVKPLVLEPGASVSTKFNALSLDGPEWPRGGYRIEFQFVLGQTGVTKSFYYMSKHHDALREKTNFSH